MCDIDRILEQLSDSSIKVIEAAKEEAKMLGHNFIGTEMLLLGLIGHRCKASRAIMSAGIKLKRTRVEILSIIGRGSGYYTKEIPLTPKCRQVLKLSLKEAERQNQTMIGSEHILLGLIQEISLSKSGVAYSVLKEMDVDLDKLRSNILEQIVIDKA